MLIRKLLPAAALSLAVAAPVALARLDNDEPLQSYRQSYFAMLAMNFGPIADMVKGDIEWDQDRLETLAADVERVSDVSIESAFSKSAMKGTTRAKPEIWDNMDDFQAKLDDLRTAADGLKEAAMSGDRGAVAQAVRSTGGACKACHDEYKSKDYLY